MITSKSHKNATKITITTYYYLLHFGSLGSRPINLWTRCERTLVLSFSIKAQHGMHSIYTRAGDCICFKKVGKNCGVSRNIRQKKTDLSVRDIKCLPYEIFRRVLNILISWLLTAHNDNLIQFAIYVARSLRYYLYDMLYNLPAWITLGKNRSWKVCFSFIFFFSDKRVFFSSRSHFVTSYGAW